jgi:hypothetical protein
MSNVGNGSSAYSQAVAIPAANSGRTASGARGRPFQPGQSGNPRGRPARDFDLAELARCHTQEAVGTLLQVMRDAKSPAAARIAAAGLLIDRGWGKAPQALNMRHQFDFAAEFEAFLRSLSAGSTGEP